MKLLKRFNEKIRNAVLFIKVMTFIIVEISIIICFMSIDAPSYISLLFSNVLTFILALYASKSFKLFRGTASSDTDNGFRTLQDKIRALEEDNRKLRNQHDIDEQTLTHFKSINFTAKLELLEKVDMGYIVKEESIEDLKHDPSLSVHMPKANLLERGANAISNWLNVSHDPWSILFVDKVYHKSTIGIDLSRIKYSTNRFGEIFLCGVQREILHDVSSELERNRRESDVKRCWIFSTAKNGSCDIKNDDRYNRLKETYIQQQHTYTKQSYETANNALCQQMTIGLHKSLQSRYDRLRFVEFGSNEYNNLDWHPLMDACGNTIVMNILIDMYAGVKLLKDSNNV